jgi:hypothetical protein
MKTFSDLHWCCVVAGEWCCAVAEGCQSFTPTAPDSTTSLTTPELEVTSTNN